MKFLTICSRLALKSLFFLIVFESQAQDSIQKTYHLNGVLKCETPFVNGLANGTEKIYYVTGELRRETPYRDDEKEGIEKEYFKSGVLMRETPFVDGLE